MSAASDAVALALKWANDPAHGYDQASRWGPDYDCSSFLISVWEAVGVPVKQAGASYSGTMRAAFKRCGFGEIPISAGLRPGDILLNERQHTAMYIGNGQIVHAGGNEYGKATGGRTGDQTGREICVTSYFVPAYGWDCALRYEGSEQAPAPTGPEKPAEGATAPQTPAYRPGDRYMVQPGDTLWGIAERYLGDGSRWHDLYAYNNLPSTEIHIGDVIELPPADWTENSEMPEPSPAPDPEPGDGDLPQLRRGSTGQAVKVLQILLRRAGYPLPIYGVDGDFGAETEKALCDYQRAQGLTVTGTTTPVTWEALLQG